jgi:hypothetical protein
MATLWRDVWLQALNAICDNVKPEVHVERGYHALAVAAD